MRSKVVAEGVHFPEGPVWCPEGTLVITSVTAGALYRIDVQQGRTRLIADTGGGANGAALASDGGFVVAQNGGIDLTETGVIEDAPSPRRTDPGVQRVLPSGEVEVVVANGFRAPNDICVGADGTIYFTDPGHFPPPDTPVGRVMAITLATEVRVVGEDFWYCNGIAVDRDGSLVVVERTGLMRVDPETGDRQWVIEHLGEGAGDGFCLDAEGHFYVASTLEHGIRVVDPDGAVADFLPIEGDGLSTNCCFGGDDLRTLFVTDGLPGRVVAFEGMPTPGLPLPTWPAP